MGSSAAPTWTASYAASRALPPPPHRVAGPSRAVVSATRAASTRLVPATADMISAIASSSPERPAAAMSSMAPVRRGRVEGAAASPPWRQYESSDLEVEGPRLATSSAGASVGASASAEETEVAAAAPDEVVPSTSPDGAPLDTEPPADESSDSPASTCSCTRARVRWRPSTVLASPVRVAVVWNTVWMAFSTDSIKSGAQD
mmetsp:Transcript_28534/g.92562  ORF Transcript_28534/g.92562 Transcript_28534/m.92562 type:complete len:202 (-) Transcript_28534:3146-3751(-)